MSKLRRIASFFVRQLSVLRQARQEGTLKSVRLYHESKPWKPPVRPYYYLGGNRALTQLSNGLPFFVNTDDVTITSWVVLMGEWEPSVDKVLTRLCDKGMRVCDLGANLGYYTIKLANIVGDDGHVLALEPNPELFPFMRDSVLLNGFTQRVRAENLAAGAVSGTMTLSYPSISMGGGSLFSVPPHPSLRSAEVKMVAIDDLTDGQPGFDLIKIDVEGWEPEVLKGMSRTLARSEHASIVTEVSWAQWSHFCDPVAKLDELIGSRDGVFIIRNDGSLERVSRDNLDCFHTIGVSYALLTHWTPDHAARLGDLVRPSRAYNTSSF